MMKNFDTCMTMLLHHEGGFTADKRDKGNANGGSTNLGVTSAVWADWTGTHAGHDVMKALTPEDVKPLYKHNYWDRVKGDNLPSGLDWALFDWAVNSGSGRAARSIQRIVGVEADGGIGPLTLTAIGDFEVKYLLDKLHYSRQSFYESLDDFQYFGNGWSRRNNETYEQALEMMD
jgi:lysozyme family protein